MNPIPKVGERYADKDPRHEGRVVEVRQVNFLGSRAKVQAEVNPLNPSAVGRHSWISFAGLAKRYTKVSH
jgi:hypothetical protein